MAQTAHGRPSRMWRVVNAEVGLLELALDDEEDAGRVERGAATRLRARLERLGDHMATMADRLDRIARLMEWPQDAA